MTMLVKYFALLPSIFATTTLALGSITVKNKCSDSIYYEVVAGSDDAESKVKEMKSNEDYTKQLPSNTKPGDGIRIKLSTTPDHLQKEYAKVEYSVSHTESMVFYDLNANQGNNNPFADYGMSVTIGDEYCLDLDCPAGQKLCPPVLYPIGYSTTFEQKCSDSENMTAVMCSGRY